MPAFVTRQSVESRVSYLLRLFRLVHAVLVADCCVCSQVPQRGMTVLLELHAFAQAALALLTDFDLIGSEGQ